MITIPIVSNALNPLNEIRLVLFGMKPGIPLHEAIIAVIVIAVVGFVFYKYRYKGDKWGD